MEQTVEARCNCSMKKIVLFFKDAHYGDLFTCKEYVRQVYEELKDSIEVEYYHNLHPRSMIDIGIKQIDSLYHTKIPKKFAYPVIDDIMHVNIWLAQRVAFDDKVGLNHSTLYRAWKEIFSKINETIGSNLQLKSIKDYVPQINYSLFSDNKKLNKYLVSSHNRKRILISNGPALSGQSFSNNLEEIIFLLSRKYPGFDFICTHRFNKQTSNIFFTDDITSQDALENFNYDNRKTCDLNEISYLSTFCQAIIGKNSGPYIYCLTRENIFNPNKIILSMHRRANDDMTIDIDRKCKYFHYRIWEERFDPKNVLKELDIVIRSII